MCTMLYGNKSLIVLFNSIICIWKVSHGWFSLILLLEIPKETLLAVLNISREKEHNKEDEMFPLLSKVNTLVQLNGPY